MTTPTEKDAMALAVLADFANDVAENYERTPFAKVGRADFDEARAHLASRIAELEADNERLRGAFDTEDEKASVHWYGEWVEQKRRSDRAEAELAAVREDADKRLALIVRIRDDKSWRSNDNSLWPDIVDAARGGGDV